MREIISISRGGSPAHETGASPLKHGSNEPATERVPKHMFDTAKTSRIRRLAFYDLQAPTKQPFDTPALYTSPYALGHVPKRCDRQAKLKIS